MNLVIYLVVSFVFTAILGKIFIPILKKMKEMMDLVFILEKKELQQWVE